VDGPVAISHKWTQIVTDVLRRIRGNPCEFVANKTDNPKPLIFTIGHSTHPIDEFIRLLQAHGVKRLVDVRTVPRSRHNPQFNRDSLPAALRKAQIFYTHLRELGGLRHPDKDSPNTGWRNAGFRGYADYMQTPEFEKGLGKLLELAVARQVAIMCAEAVPWRCHRSLIADALTVHGVPVEHITSRTHCHPHKLTPFAKVVGRQLIYWANATPSLPGLDNAVK